MDTDGITGVGKADGTKIGFPTWPGLARAPDDKRAAAEHPVGAGALPEGGAGAELILAAGTRAETRGMGAEFTVAGATGPDAEAINGATIMVEEPLGRANEGARMGTGARIGVGIAGAGG